MSANQRRVTSHDMRKSCETLPCSSDFHDLLRSLAKTTGDHSFAYITDNIWQSFSALGFLEFPVAYCTTELLQ